MRITKSHKSYFYFSLEQSDYWRHGYTTCRRFLNRLMKEIPGGRRGDRFWLNDMKAWAIHKDREGEFRRLLADYFGMDEQKDVFYGANKRSVV